MLETHLPITILSDGYEFACVSHLVDVLSKRVSALASLQDTSSYSLNTTQLIYSILASLLEARNIVAGEIGRVKQRYGKDVYDPQREAELKENMLRSLNEKLFAHQYVSGINDTKFQKISDTFWDAVMKNSRERQKSLEPKEDQRVLSDDTVYQTELAPLRKQISEISNLIVELIAHKVRLQVIISDTSGAEEFTSIINIFDRF